VSRRHEAVQPYLGGTYRRGSVVARDGHSAHRPSFT
jgi:hypothetical protein